MKSDEELISDFKNGNSDAFVEILRRYQNQVFGLAYRYVGDYDEAVEIAQDTFVRFYRYSHSLSHINRLQKYLFTIAANLSRNVLRRYKRRESLPDYDDESDNDIYDAMVAGSEYRPDARIDRTELAQQIQHALMKLPAVLREVIILRDIKEYSYEDIAEITVTKLGTVRSRINRARKILQILLADAHSELSK